MFIPFPCLFIFIKAVRIIIFSLYFFLILHHRHRHPLICLFFSSHFHHRQHHYHYDLIPVLLHFLCFFMIVVIIISLFRYHLPRSWLQPTRNLLVVFEEVGGNAEKISLTKRTVCGICASVSEFHPTVQNFHVDQYGKPEESSHLARVHLRCSPGQSISAIKFASFGTPSGSCGSFQEGTCHSPSSRSILEEVTFSLHFSLLIVFQMCFAA